MKRIGRKDIKLKYVIVTYNNRCVGSSSLGIIKKGGVELIINVPWLIKNLSFLMLLDSIRLYY